MTRAIIALMLLVSPCWAQDHDQGAVFYAAEGARVELHGNFEWDGKGWGWCVDGESPALKNELRDDGWHTVIDCRGTGGSFQGMIGDPNSRGCEDEPLSSLYVDGSKWQIYVHCRKSHVPPVS
jgi:hypothetical protein